MKQAMQKWLKRYQTDFDTDTAHKLCSKLGLDGDKVDDCLSLCYQLETDKITQEDFTGGLVLLSGLSPGKLAEKLKNIREAPSDPKKD